MVVLTYNSLGNFLFYIAANKDKSQFINFEYQIL